MKILIWVNKTQLPLLQKLLNGKELEVGSEPIKAFYNDMGIPFVQIILDYNQLITLQDLDWIKVY